MSSNGKRPSILDRNKEYAAGFRRGNFTPKSSNLTRSKTAESLIKANRALATSERRFSNGYTARPSPGARTINKQFEKLLAGLHSSGGKENLETLRKQTIDQKWRMICDQDMSPPLHEPDFYIDQLRRHMDPELHSGKKSSTRNKKLLKELIPVSKILSDLKSDLASLDPTFLLDFISEANDGVEVIMQFLRHIQTHFPNGSVKDSKPNSYSETIRRDEQDESSCLSCLKEIMENEDGVHTLLKHTGTLETIALCLLSNSNSSRTISLECLSLACDAKEGFDYALNAMTYVKMNMREPVRFKVLVGMMGNKNISEELMLACLNFINTLLNATTNPNAKVYLLYELEMANFNPFIITKFLQLNFNEEISQNLEIWYSRYLDVQNLQDTCQALSSRNDILREEVNNLKTMLPLIEDKCEKLEQNVKELEETKEKYRIELSESKRLASELQEELNQASGQLVQKDHLQIPETIIDADYDPASETSSFFIPTPLGGSMENLADQQTTSFEFGSKQPEDTENLLAAMISKAQAAYTSPPVPPPPPPPAQLMDSRFDTLYPGLPRKKATPSNLPLPMLNWTPLVNPKDTIFMKFDEENVYKEVSLKDFEKNFQTLGNRNKIRDAHLSITQKKMDLKKEKIAKQIYLIEPRRARNLIISQRRIGHSAKDIRGYIDKCDLKGISGDYAEILVKFVPTKEEKKLLAQHAGEYYKLGESEQILYQMAKVDRFENKLKLMSFMGSYQSLVESLSPALENVLKASESLIKSEKLKKLLEIILAYGNYMNSSRRGAVYGFKAESLAKLLDVKSIDRKMTLLQYIARVVQGRFPSIHKWYEDLHLYGTEKASQQGMKNDIHTLRVGVELAKSEKDKQENNEIIIEFYEKASEKVHRLQELYKRMESSYKQVCMQFGENHKNIDPSDFFRYFSNLAEEYKKAAIKNDKSPFNPQVYVDEPDFVELGIDDLDRRLKEEEQIQEKEEKAAAREKNLLTNGANVTDENVAKVRTQRTFSVKEATESYERTNSSEPAPPSQEVKTSAVKQTAMAYEKDVSPPVSPTPQSSKVKAMAQNWQAENTGQGKAKSQEESRGKPGNTSVVRTGSVIKSKVSQVYLQNIGDNKKYGDASTSNHSKSSFISKMSFMPKESENSFTKF